MKTVIIPDIHHHISQVKLILLHEAPDKVVFLGDWFDDFFDTPEMSADTAIWLMKRMDRHPEDVFIWGNHDTHYGFPSHETRCSGFEQIKCDAIRDIMTGRHWDRFVFHHWEASWLCTHAGLTRPHASGVDDIKAWLTAEEQKAQEALRRSKRHWMFAAGYARGGPSPFGGVNWCDTSEFLPIQDVNQVFGHTPQGSRVWKYDTNRRKDQVKNSDNYCIDTHLRFYAVIRDGIFEIKDSITYRFPESKNGDSSSTG